MKMVYFALVSSTLVGLMGFFNFDSTNINSTPLFSTMFIIGTIASICSAFFYVVKISSVTSIPDPKQKEVDEYLDANPNISSVLSIVDDPEKSGYLTVHRATDIAFRELHALKLQVALLLHNLDTKNSDKPEKPKKKTKRKKK